MFETPEDGGYRLAAMCGRPSSTSTRQVPKDGAGHSTRGCLGATGAAGWTWPPPSWLGSSRKRNPLFHVALQFSQSRRDLRRQEQIVRNSRNLLGFLPRFLERESLA